jgi:hypothetical protein
MITSIVPKDIELAPIAIRFARNVEPGRTIEDHLLTVFYNFCHSFRGYDDFIFQVYESEKRANAARFARQKGKR